MIQGRSPAIGKGVHEALDAGVLAGYPVKGVRVRLFDGSYHSVDSSEIAFKLAGVAAMRQALEQADPVLLEPIMQVTVSVPEACVGDVIGDLNSRRGHPLGMEPVGAMTEIKAEAPMSEMLAYAPTCSITGGQGDYTLEFCATRRSPPTSPRSRQQTAVTRRGHLTGIVTGQGRPCPAPSSRACSRGITKATPYAGLRARSEIPAAGRSRTEVHHEEEPPYATNRRVRSQDHAGDAATSQDLQGDDDGQAGGEQLGNSRGRASRPSPRATNSR